MLPLPTADRPVGEQTGRPTLRVALVAVLSLALSYAFSRITGLLHETIPVPVGVPALVLAVLLTAPAPREYGWQVGTTTRHWRLLLGCGAAIVAVVVGFRLASGQVPYTPSFAEIVVVPVGEEALFRGFLLVTLLRLLAPAAGMGTTAEWTALAISAVSFGVGHLGNLGYVPTAFVLVQALAATAFGLVAGWVRVRTDSLVGPVLLHAVMNAAAVL